MKYKPGISSKRLKNRRFFRTEIAILEEYFKNDCYISVRVLVQHIKVARSTFYNHHRRIKDIPTDYRLYILRKYNRLVNKIMHEKQFNLNDAIRSVLIFIIRNKSAFHVLIESNQTEIFDEMITKLQPFIIRTLSLSNKNDKLYRIYTGEITKILSDWGKKDFKDNDFDIIYRDVCVLTKTLPKRLQMLAK